MSGFPKSVPSVEIYTPPAYVCRYNPFRRYASGSLLWTGTGEGLYTWFRQGGDTRYEAEIVATAIEGWLWVQSLGDRRMYHGLDSGRFDSSKPNQANAPKTENCHAASDGDCFWKSCPQQRDGEPHKSGRHCPLDNRQDED